MPPEENESNGNGFALFGIVVVCGLAALWFLNDNFQQRVRGGVESAKTVLATDKPSDTSELLDPTVTTPTTTPTAPTTTPTAPTTTPTAPEVTVPAQPGAASQASEPPGASTSSPTSLKPPVPEGTPEVRATWPEARGLRVVLQKRLKKATRVLKSKLKYVPVPVKIQKKWTRRGWAPRLFFWTADKKCSYVYKVTKVLPPKKGGVTYIVGRQWQRKPLTCPEDISEVWGRLSK